MTVAPRLGQLQANSETPPVPGHDHVAGTDPATSRPLQAVVPAHGSVAASTYDRCREIGSDRWPEALVLLQQPSLLSPACTAWLRVSAARPAIPDGRRDDRSPTRPW